MDHPDPTPAQPDSTQGTRKSPAIIIVVVIVFMLIMSGIGALLLRTFNPGPTATTQAGTQPFTSGKPSDTLTRPTGESPSTQQTPSDTDLVVLGIGISRVGTTTIGSISNTDGDSWVIENVEIASTEKEFMLSNSQKITKSLFASIKANPANYKLVVDADKKVTFVEKTK